MISMSRIARLHLGHFTVPGDADDHRAGQQIVCAGYLIRHPQGLVLFDTGIGEGDSEAETQYRPMRRSLGEALDAVGLSRSDVTLVINCHLHFDHSGENFRFPGRPILAQAVEYEAAHDPGYTMPSAYEFAGATFELVDGEADVAPGLRIIPTPGHVPGHQSLVVETHHGRIVIAGQAFNEASEYARAQFALELEAGGTAQHAPYPDWIARFAEFDPVRVLFAHDLALWERDPGSATSRGVPRGPVPV